MRWAPLLFLVGCDRLSAAGDLVNALGDTTVVQGLFIGADVPDGIDIPEESGIYTAACKVFLAEVDDADNFEDSPLAGAEVRFDAPGGSDLGFAEDDEEDGKYLLTSLEGLKYEPGQDATIRFSTAGEEGSVTVRAPEAPEVEFPERPIAGKAMRVAVIDGKFANVVAAVYDFDHEKLTWDNLPDDVSAAYELNEDGEDEPIEELLIPGEAFKRPSTYIVGVGGLEVADTDSFEGANTVYSTFAAAQLTIQIVVISD